MSLKTTKFNLMVDLDHPLGTVNVVTEPCAYLLTGYWGIYTRWVRLLTCWWRRRTKVRGWWNSVRSIFWGAWIYVPNFMAIYTECWRNSYFDPMMTLYEKLRGQKVKGNLSKGKMSVRTWQSICRSFVLICWLDTEIFYWISENFDLAGDTRGKDCEGRVAG